MEEVMLEKNDHETTGQGEDAAMPATKEYYADHIAPAPEHPAEAMASVHELRHEAEGKSCAPAGERELPREAKAVFAMFYRELVESGQIPPLPGGELPKCLR